MSIDKRDREERERKVRKARWLQRDIAKLQAEINEWNREASEFNVTLNMQSDLFVTKKLDDIIAENSDD